MNRDESSARHYEEDTLHDASEETSFGATTQITKRNTKLDQLEAPSRNKRLPPWVAYVVVFTVVLVSTLLLFQRIVRLKEEKPQAISEPYKTIVSPTEEVTNESKSKLFVPKQETLRLWYGLGSEHAKSFKFGSPEIPDTALYYLAIMKEQDPDHVLTQQLSQDISNAFLRFAKLKQAYGDTEGFKNYQLLAKQYESRRLLQRNPTKVTTKYYLSNGDEIPQSVITDLYEQLEEAASVWNLEPESKRGTALNLLQRMYDINPKHELIPRAHQQIAHAYYALYKLAQTNGDEGREAIYLAKLRQHYSGQL